MDCLLHTLCFWCLIHFCIPLFFLYWFFFFSGSGSVACEHGTCILPRLTVSVQTLSVLDGCRSGTSDWMQWYIHHAALIPYLWNTTHERYSPIYQWWEPSLLTCTFVTPNPTNILKYPPHFFRFYAAPAWRGLEGCWIFTVEIIDHVSIPTYRSQGSCLYLARKECIALCSLVVVDQGFQTTSGQACYIEWVYNVSDIFCRCRKQL